MPGLLRPDALCPACGDPLVALSDLTRPGSSYRFPVVREFFHELVEGKRRRNCRVRFRTLALAQTEREMLEVPRRDAVKQ